MDVDHAGTPIMTIGTGDAPVAIGMMTELMIIIDVGVITATGDLTGTITGEIATVTGEIAMVTGEIATVPGEIAMVTGEIATVTGEIATLPGEIAIGTWPAIEPGIAAAARRFALVVGPLEKWLCKWVSHFADVIVYANTYRPEPTSTMTVLPDSLIAVIPFPTVSGFPLSFTFPSTALGKRTVA